MFTSAMMARTAELIGLGKKTTAIAEILTSEFAVGITKSDVLPLLEHAIKEGILTLNAPIEGVLGRMIAEKLGFDPESITVLNAVHPDASERLFKAGLDRRHAFVSANFEDHVSRGAAHILHERLLKFSKTRASQGRPVKLGLGPGRATHGVIMDLAQILERSTLAGKIQPIAITAGGPRSQPIYDPSVLMASLPEDLITSPIKIVERSVVTQREYDNGSLLENPDFRAAWNERDAIDVIVTSMCDSRDEHDLHMSIMDENHVPRGDLIQQGCVGNVQYRPYSATGPIIQNGDEKRAVTLFELGDFVRMADSRHHEVVLIARSCGMCKWDRSEALWPLLTVPSLKVWSTLILDLATARGVLRLIEERLPRNDGK